jgi:Asp-tRNA(Asn)/Glu-tRNA(Gln) amidotransferase A subunit family amidase
MQSPFLDTLGVFASSVEDLALVIDVLAGYDANDNVTSLVPNPQTLATCQGKVPVAPTFALVEPPHYERASQDMRDALDELGEFLGENVFSTTLPKAFEEAISARETINFAEMAKCYYRYSKNNSEQLSTILSNAITKGESTSARDYIAALDWRDLLNAGLEEFFERCDALIIPSALGGAPGLETTGDAVFNGIWTLCGNPVVNLPLFTDSEGMPMGVQIIGKRGEDGRTLRTARWLIEQLQKEVATQEVA